jgi:hypothetical protein
MTEKDRRYHHTPDEGETGPNQEGEHGPHRPGETDPHEPLNTPLLEAPETHPRSQKMNNSAESRPTSVE